MKGKVISLAVSHKNGSTVLRAGDSVTENDVNNFAELVEGGHIELTDEDESDEDESDLMALKKGDLQLKCVELDLDYQESDTKSELVEKIEGADVPK